MERKSLEDHQEESKVEPMSPDELITYPAGFSVDEPELSLSKDREPMPAIPKSYFFISNKFESLDYMSIMNQLEIEKDKTDTFRTLMLEDTIRIIYFVLSGLITALINVVIEIGIVRLGHIKFKYLGEYIEHYHKGNVNEMSTIILVFIGIFWFLGIIIPVMIGSMLVVFVAPFAAGGGVAQCVAYLNGVRVPHVLSIKGLVIKVLSTTCTCISGLAAGREGPMMHIGAITGGSIPSAFPYQVFKSDHERRDLAAAGFGAGIAVAFGTPIGGLLLALEEGVSFWNIRLMWRTYLCIVIGYFFATFLLSWEAGYPGDLSNSELLTFGGLSDNVTSYEFFEIGFFLIIGVIGGLLGAAITAIHIRMTIFRKRFVQTKTRKLIESFIVSCIFAFLSLFVLLTYRSCSKYEDVSSSTCQPTTHSLYDTERKHQWYCKINETSDMSILFLDTQENVINKVLEPINIQVTSLLIFSCIYFLMLCLSMGLTISGGIFVPQIVLGAAWGRLFGTILSNLSGAKWARPEKYAYLGATAQLSGTVGKTFSILVIMIEASNNISFSFPLMVIVSVTKYVETLFVMPIYETQMHMMGMPFLPSQSPPVNVAFPTSRTMSNSPTVNFPITPTVQMIVDTLRSCNHNGFPVVGETDESKRNVLIGLILRQQLLVLLKCKAYKYPPPQTSKQMCQCRDVYLKEARKTLQIDKIFVDDKYYSYVMDLTPYYNRFPYTVRETLPFVHTYQLFRSLGLRHIVVINNNNEPIAMVTRKDLAKFHVSEVFCKKNVRELAIKP